MRSCFLLTWLILTSLAERITVSGLGIGTSGLELLGYLLVVAHLLRVQFAHNKYN